jgi:hypothetical protein
MIDWTLNIWNDFFSTWGQGDPPSFPVVYKFENGKTKTADNKDTLLSFVVDDLGDRSSAAIWELVLVEKFDPRLVQTPSLNNYIARYNYSKELGVAPYPGSYDEQPAEFVDFVSFLSAEIPKCAEAKRKRNG